MIWSASRTAAWDIRNSSWTMAYDSYCVTHYVVWFVVYHGIYHVVMRHELCYVGVVLRHALRHVMCSASRNISCGNASRTMLCGSRIASWAMAFDLKWFINDFMYIAVCHELSHIIFVGRHEPIQKIKAPHDIVRLQIFKVRGFVTNLQPHHITAHVRLRGFKRHVLQCRSHVCGTSYEHHSRHSIRCCALLQRCSMLQCVAVCCSVSHVCHTSCEHHCRHSICWNIWLQRQCVALCCIVLHCVALCCSALHCVVVRCSALQCVAVSCSALQCVAVRCSAL